MRPKGYIIGFSSGMFYIVDQKEKESLLTIPRKIFKGAIEGVKFTQVDLESITELNEPYLKKGIERMKKLGMRFGFHGESYAMGGGEKPMGMLDSSIESHYEHSHDRLIQHIEGIGKLGGEFVNIHPSETTPFISLSRDLQPSKLVDPWGRPLRKLLEENSKLLNWVMETPFLWEFTRRTPQYVVDELLRNILNRFYQQNPNKTPTENEMKKMREEAIGNAKQFFLHEITTSELSYGAERVAYYIIAKWMQNNKDPLWKHIVGKSIPDDKLPEKHQDWVPAVSSKYIWGHFNPRNSKYKDPKSLLKKYRLYFVFETQMGSAGLEGLYRLMRPRDMALLCRTIGSDWVGVCIDFEHVLSQNISPKKDIESMPHGLAKFIKVLHLGWPTPHAPAHIPIPVGSEAHIYLYERLFELRQRGMKDAYLIFERAAAARGSTILALRLIKKFLEKNVEPKELPLEFFGIDEKGPNVKRQEVAVREHFLDPMKGMLAVPEEEYTFFSKAATEKGKAEVWKKEKYR